MELNKINRLLFSAFIIAMLLGACSDDELGGNDMIPGGGNPGIDQDTTSTMMDTTTNVTDMDIEPQYLALKSDYIFDQEALHTYELIIPEENLDILDNDPAAEEYVEGTLVFQGDTITPVGIRYKGSIGAFVGCVSGLNWTNPSGSKTCTKLSMKVKINWEGREEKFYGLKKLQLHSMNNDDSQMRERLGYHLFREMGVPAPRVVHSKLIINGEYNGLFAVVEHIDGRFAKYNWDDDDGNLYKEAWPLDMQGRPHSDAYYQAALKTNEEIADVSLMKNFANKLESAQNTSETQAVIEEHMDVDEILSYCVVDRMIRHDDGPFHWYCNGGNCSNHNFYWYVEPNADRFHLVAWDLDNAFENILNESNPVTPIADDFGETRNNCQPFSYGWLGIQQWSAACDKLTDGWASYETEYAAKKADFKAGVFSAGEIEEKLFNWSEQIRSATIDANNLHGDAVSPNRWNNAMNTLRQQVEYSRLNG